MEAVEAWLDGEHIDPRGYPRVYRAALTAQNLIGWHSFLRGYWSTYWIQLHDAHLKRTNQYSNKMTGKIWASRMILHIWDKVQEGWKLHNDKVHGKTTLLEDADLRRRTIAKIYTLHRMRRKVLHDHVDYLFLTDIRTTLRTATLNYLRNWIRLYEPSIRESIRTAQSNSVRNTKSITTYFRPQQSSRKRPPKPRFDQRTRILRDGRQKTRKRSKALPNPTRNRITRYFRPTSRPNQRPRSTLITPSNAQRPTNPYLPHHPMTNPYPPALLISIATATAPATIQTHFTTFTTLPPPSQPRPINPYAPYHVTRNSYRPTLPAQPTHVPVPSPSPSPRALPQPPRPQLPQIRNPYARKT
jgi:hypothetical protein